jgi:iron complex outermembrane receptor protein
MVSESGAFAGTLLAISVSLGATNPAYAQANAALENEQARVAQDAGNAIVVTAQKRVERLQDVPVSITVVDGRSLRDLNFTEATDLQFLAAGVGLGDSNTPRGAGFRIRGVGTVAFADGIEQSVGTVVDGVPLARAGQGLADLIDIERIEVLRGPQGMLFGRNASAGLINIVTKRPVLDDVTVEGRASYGSDNDLQLGASLAAPIIRDVAGFRVTGFLNQRDGFVTNLADGQDLNARKEYGLRGSLLIEPTNTLEIILRGDWSKRNNRANIWTIRALTSDSLLLATPVPGTIPPVLSPQVSAQAGPRNRVVDIGGALFNRVESWGLSGEVNVALGDYTVTSVTAYRDWQQSDNNDTDQSRFNLLDLNLGTNDLYQFSQELRLTSPQDQPISFVAGLFYYESGNANTSIQRGKFVPVVAQLNSIGVSVPLGPILIGPGDLAGRRVDTNVEVRDFAAFGQASLNLSDAFKIILGARYTDTKVSSTFLRTAADGTSASFNVGLGAAFAPAGYDLKTSDGNLSYRAGIQFAPNPDINFYATYSRGYKGPGFDTLPEFTINPGSTALESALVRPEIPTSYEAGAKASLANGKVTLSLAVFRTEFRDFQAQLFEVPPGDNPGSFRVRNAGELSATGFELDVNAQPVEGFTVGFGLAYADTVFEEFRGAACSIVAQASTVPGNPCAGGRPSFDASGLRAPNAPALTMSINSRYDHQFPGSVAGFIQANSLLRSDNSFGLVPQNVPNPYVQDGYVVLNLAVGLTLADGRFGISAFAKNLFDQNFVTGIFDLPFAGPGDLAQYVTRDAERLVGVQLNVNF